MRRSRVRNRIWVVAALILTFWSCYEPEEGCLDPDATNYDVNADNDCDGCCNLPTYGILMSFLMDGESYVSGDSFLVSSDGIRVEDFHFFISDVSFLDVDGNRIEFEDQFNIYGVDGTGTLTFEDFKYYADNQFRGTFEGFRYGGTLDKITFKIGLSEQINYYDRDSLELNTDLDDAPDEVYLNENEGYEFYSFTVSDLQDNQLEIVYADAYPLPAVEVNLDGEMISRGFNDDINLFIDFGVIFDGINITTMDQAEILSRINLNIPRAFGKR